MISFTKISKIEVNTTATDINKNIFTLTLGSPSDSGIGGGSRPPTRKNPPRIKLIAPETPNIPKPEICTSR